MAYQTSESLGDHSSIDAAINNFSKGLVRRPAPKGHRGERDRTGTDLDPAAPPVLAAEALPEHGHATRWAAAVSTPSRPLPTSARH